MPKPDEVSLKGLDQFAKRFLRTDAADEKERIAVAPGQKLSEENLRRYEQERLKSFIERAGLFTEDLIGFIVEQRKKRELTDTESVFALALTNINLRNAYGSSQNESDFTPEKGEQLLEEFDEICRGAQDYFDANG